MRKQMNPLPEPPPVTLYARHTALLLEVLAYLQGHWISYDVLLLPERAKDKVLERRVGDSLDAARRNLEELLVRHAHHFNHPLMSDDAYRRAMREAVGDVEYRDVAVLARMARVMGVEQTSWWSRE